MTPESLRDGAPASKGLAFLDVLSTLHIAVLCSANWLLMTNKFIHSFIHSVIHSFVGPTLTTHKCRCGLLRPPQ